MSFARENTCSGGAEKAGIAKYLRARFVIVENRPTCIYHCQ